MNKKHHRLDPYPLSISILENIPDGCAETFPFDLIDELKEEYF